MLVVHTRIIRIAGIVLVMCIVLSAVYFVSQGKDNTQLTVAVLDIGQGDAIFVDGPKDQQVLIDTGPARRVLAEVGRYMPFYDRKIELVVITHPHEDHYGGLHEILQRYDVGRIYITGVVLKDRNFDDLLDQARQKGVEVQEVWRGTEVDMGSDIHLSVLAPVVPLDGVKMSDLNESSIVAKLAYKQSTFLFTGDATDKEEKAIMAQGDDLSADVLKVGHHGSEYSTSEEWLNAVHPEVAVISAGVKNRYGHPHPRLLKRLERGVSKIFRTDHDGDVVFKSDGQTIGVSTGSSSGLLSPWLSSQSAYTIN